MEEKDFWDKYWYKNTQLITVTNPRDEDFIFQSTVETGIDMATGRMKTEQRKYRVPAHGEERFPGPIANMYLDQVSKLIAQDEDKFQFMIDFSLRAQYYDRLTVNIEDLIMSYEPRKEYLQGAVDDEQPVKEPENPAFTEAKTPKKPGRPAKEPANEA